MGDKKKISMTVITLIIGFMTAIQFQTVNEPVIRDTRDTSQLREDLVKEKELYLRLVREIRSNEEKIEKYETEKLEGKEQALIDTLREFKAEAGLEKYEGPGIVINILPVSEDLLLGETVEPIPPYLLHTLINELNRFGAAEISIADQRWINTSVIRDINGITKMDGYPLDHFPIEVKVAVDNMDTAEKLYNRMQVSNSAEEFFIQHFRLSISTPQPTVNIPAYRGEIKIRNMELGDIEKGG
jgi:uncharacterized protein YlxW (UPF0749 family)